MIFTKQSTNIIFFIVCNSFLCTVNTTPLYEAYDDDISNEYDSHDDSQLDVEHQYLDEEEEVMEEDNALNYRCPNAGFSISIKLLCDNYPDCDDGSDESAEICEMYGRKINPPTLSTIRKSTAFPLDAVNLDYNEYASCLIDEFQCTSLPGLCIPQNSVCDGDSDCPDGEDESICADKEDSAATARPLTVLSTIPEIRMASPLSRTLISPKQFQQYNNHNPSLWEDQSAPDTALAPQRTTDYGNPLQHHNADSTRREEIETHLQSTVTAPPTTTMPLTALSWITKPKIAVLRTKPVYSTQDIRFISVMTETEDKNSAIEAVLRHLPNDQTSTDVQDYSAFTGETGETDADDYSRIHLMSNHQVEEFLQNLVRRENTNDVDNILSPVASTESVNVVSLPSTTTYPTTTLVKTTTSKSKRHGKSTRKSHKKKVKGLLYKLVRNVGKLLTSDVENQDLNVNIRIGGTSKNSKTTNHGSDAIQDDDLTIRRDRKRKSRVRLNIELNL